MTDQNELLLRLGWREIGGLWVAPEDLYTYEEAVAQAKERYRAEIRRLKAARGGSSQLPFDFGEAEE